jgi:hypothetical protein
MWMGPRLRGDKKHACATLVTSSPRRRPGPTLACDVCRPDGTCAVRVGGSPPSWERRTVLDVLAPSSTHPSPRRRPGPTLACDVCRPDRECAAQVDGSPPSPGRQSNLYRFPDSIVAAAKAGAHACMRRLSPGSEIRCARGWVPAFAGTTVEGACRAGSGCSGRKKWRPRVGRQCPCKGSGRTPSGERPGVQAVGGTRPRVESGHAAARPRLGDWHTLRRAAAGPVPVPNRNLLPTQELAGSS